MTAIPKRPLGATGLHVSEVGLGAWAAGGRAYGHVDDRSGEAIVERYLDLGGNFIDTARKYGASEERIGRVLKARGCRDDVILCTKLPGIEGDMVRGVRDALHASLAALQTETIDVYLIHSPPDDPRERDALLDELDKHRRDGIIRFIGASIKGPAVTDATAKLCRAYIDTGRIQAIELIYSVFRQKLAEDGVLQACAERGVGTIVRTVLESGFLTGKYKAGHVFSDHRARWTDEKIQDILSDVESFRSYLTPDHPTFVDLAVRFALDNSHTSTVILGATSPEQVNANVAAGLKPQLPADIRRNLHDDFRGRTSRYNP